MSLEQEEKRYAFKGTFGSVGKIETVQSPIDADEFERLFESATSGKQADPK